MAFKPSKFQQAIYDFVAKGVGNAVVNAVAGSGKTTTLLGALSLIDTTKRVIFLAFNRSIKGEIEEKVKDKGLDNVDVKTCHGFGMSTLYQHLPFAPEVDTLKYRKLIRAIFEFHEKPNNWKAFAGWDVTGTMDMVNAFRVDWDMVDSKTDYINNILQLAELGRMNLTTDVQSLEGLAKKFGVHLHNGEARFASYLVEIGSANLRRIDYADMIYLPNRLGLETNTYDIVFIDECQDLNTAQRELMRRAIKPEVGRFVAVGDKNQAIYGFAGADAESFEKLTNLPNTVQLPLSVCYRCGSDIIQEAKRLVPQIEPFEGASTGKFDSQASVKDIMDGDMVLCRNSYPLVKLCLAFLKNGQKATIMGGDIGRSLVKMVRDTDQPNMEKVFDQLYHNLGLILKRIMRAKSCTESDAKETAEYGNALEKINVIEALYEEGMTIEDLVSKLEGIFNDTTKEGIVLSTIHKSKGLEANRVFIIHPEKMPSSFARQDWEFEQEDNLKYVAYTRAKSLLGIVRDFDAYGDAPEESFANKVNKVIEPKHVGIVNGAKYLLEGTVKEVRAVPSWDTFIYVIEDKEGNVFEKWGDIHPRYSTDNVGEIVEGSSIRAKVTISKHKEFKGVKKNEIKHFSKA